MRTRRSVPLALSCAAVALAGCGSSSSLLDGSTASELQESLGRVRAAIDEGRCSQARSAARTGAERVDALPSSVDSELRDTLKRGFDELSSSVGTDCETRTPTTTTTVPTETTTTTAPTEPAEPTTTTTTPTDPTTTDPSTPTLPDEPVDPVDPTDPTIPDDDDGSGGVVPGVDGPGASERSAPRGRGVDDLKQRWKDLKKRAKDAMKGRGDG